MNLLHNSRRYTSRLLAMIVMVVLTACNTKVEPGKIEADNEMVEHDKRFEVQFQPAASVQEIMKYIVDPNADEVWNAVRTTITTAGIEEHAPKTDAEWDALKGHAITLAEASHLLIMQGRQVAAAGASTSSVPAELDAAEIQNSLRDYRKEFVVHAQALHDATQQAIVAINAHDTDGLVRAGGVIDHACESCHARFWYPSEQRPLFPPLAHKTP